MLGEWGRGGVETRCGNCGQDARLQRCRLVSLKRVKRTGTRVGGPTTSAPRPDDLREPFAPVIHYPPRRVRLAQGASERAPFACSEFAVGRCPLRHIVRGIGFRSRGPGIIFSFRDGLGRLAPAKLDEKLNAQIINWLCRVLHLGIGRGRFRLARCQHRDKQG